MSDAKARLANLTVQTKSFLAALHDMKDETLELEGNLQERMAAARQELEGLNVEIENRRAEHKQVLASLASLNREKDKIRDALDDCMKRARAVA
jgi:chromosome segregation ATPase